MKSICLFTVRNDLEIVLVDLVATPYSRIH
jgi:hypothetical protein